MLDRETLNALRQNPTEWRRRGLTPPDALAEMVEARVSGTSRMRRPLDPSYADFFQS
jgi:hypothetical protein